jgi:hypothetical protein
LPFGRGSGKRKDSSINFDHLRRRWRWGRDSRSKKINRMVLRIELVDLRLWNFCLSCGGLDIKWKRRGHFSYWKMVIFSWTDWNLSLQIGGNRRLFSTILKQETQMVVVNNAALVIDLLISMEKPLCTDRTLPRHRFLPALFLPTAGLTPTHTTTTHSISDRHREQSQSLN